jgi:heme oxygenase
MKKEKELKISGDLTVTLENQHNFKNLTEVSGYIDVQEGATLTAPALTKSGSIYVRQGATLTAPALTEVSGYIDVQEGATLTAPALTKSGSIYVQEGATLTAPALTKSGYIDVRQGATLTAPALTKSGSIYVRQGATLTAPALTEVSGYIDVQEGATLTAPALTKSGSIYVQEGATLTAPALTKSGSIYVRQGATLTAPALTEVSGYIDVQEGATLNIPQIKDLRWKAVDNTLFVIESDKTSKGIKIYTGYVIQSIQEGKSIKKACFVSEKDGFYAHGETLKGSISDLQFKIASEKLKNDPINEDTLLTVNHYRLITGACDFGCRSFMESNGIPFKIENQGTGNERTVEVNPIKAIDLFKLLKKTTPFGFDKFKSLVTFEC